MEAARAAAAAAASIVATGSAAASVLPSMTPPPAVAAARRRPTRRRRPSTRATEALKAAAAAEPFPATPTVLKLALPETQAGGVIGRGGAVVQRIVSQSGAVIKISNSDELLPRTRERVCTITRTLAQVHCAQRLVSQQLATVAAGGGEEPVEVNPQGALKLVLPHVSVGVIIGKGGEVIRGLMSETGANVQISNVDEKIEATQEQIVNVSGTVIACDACQQRISASEAPLTQQHVNHSDTTPHVHHHRRPTTPTTTTTTTTHTYDDTDHHHPHVRHHPRTTHTFTTTDDRRRDHR